MGQFSDQFNAVVDGAQNPQANANLTAGVATNPDAAATNLQLGRRFGVHPDVAAAMQDDFKQRAASEDAQVQIADAPKTAAYIAADPVRAQVSHDDVGVLGTIENTLEGYGQSMLNHFGMAVNAVRGIATNPTTGIDIAKNTPAALASGAVGQAAGFAGAAKLAGDASSAVDYTQGIQQRLFGGTVEGKMSSYFGSAATSLAGEAARLAPNPTGNYVADQSLGAVQSLPGVVVALGGGMGARAMGWSAEAASALGALSMGVPSAGGFYQKATDAGVSPLKAGIGAVAEGAAMTAAGYAGELPFIKATDAGAPLIMRYLQSQIPEQAGMQGANLVNQFTDWAVLPENKDKTVGEFLESLPASAATTAIQVGALGALSNFGTAGVERALGTAGHQARLDAAAAVDTSAMHDGIKSIMDLAAQSKTRERDPASFQQFMQAQVEDGPLEHVYVDGKTLAQTLSDAGPEGADLAARLPSVQEQLSEAAASGGEVRIPTAELATALPGHALEQKILGDIRVDPLADSANESKVKQDDAVDRTQQAFEKELAVTTDDNEFQRSRDNVVQGFVNKLGDTGRFTRDVNQKYGALLGDFYATQANRLGISPEDMAQRYPLDIRSQLDDGRASDMRTNQDAEPQPSLNQDQHIDPGTAATTAAENLDARAAKETDPEAKQRLQDRAAKLRSGEGDGYLGVNAMAQEARGYLLFGNDVSATPSTIVLQRNADLSTFLHESGHFFLEVMSHMAASPDAPENVKSDFAKTLKFMETDAATWAGSDFEAKREGHEKFARGFEAYLFEGKAPSEGMRGVFQHFKSWLVSVYRNNIANLNVKLNPDIRGVFDRLIASDDAIKAAEGEAGLIAQFPTKPDAMSDAEWTDYQKLGDAAHQTAADSLQTASIRDMRFASRAKDEALKRLQGEVSEKRAAVETEVRGEIESEPVYRAQDYMRRGLLDGEKQDGPTKMSRPELKAQYQLADDAFWNDLRGMTSTENGVHPMQIAELFGFGSVDEMIRALRTAPDRKELIDGETDSRMLERYGDITSPQALDRAASAAIHNEVRGRMVATELREGQKALLAGHTNENGNPSARVLAKAAKRYAEGVVSRLKVRDVRPAQFEGAERRAAAAATKALSKGDSQGFVTEKRNQLLNFHLVREARNAQDTIQKTIDYFRKFAKTGTRDAIDRSYLDQIDGMLDRFDFRTGVTDKALAQRKTLASWIESQRALGLEPNIDPAMENEANRQSYKDMTMDELKGLRDSIKNIEHLGRFKDKLLKARDERTLTEIADAVRDGVTAKAFGSTREQPFGAKSWAETAKSGVFDALTTLRKLSSLAREMDGNENGPVWEHLIRPLNDASVDEQGRIIDATTKLKELFKNMGDERPWAREYDEHIGQSISHEDRLMMALNWGNDLNRQRLMDGNKLTQDQIEGTLGKLTKQDWDFVQGVWRHIDSHWGDISSQALRMDGVAPEKQEGVQFAQKSADGHDLQIDGGYFPLKYNADKDGQIDAYREADIAQAMQRAAFTRSTTRRGFLKERAETVKHPVRLDFGVIFQHHAEVIHDLAYRETLTDANRIFGRVEPTVRQHYGPEVSRAFKKTFEDIAAGNLGARNAYDKGIAYLRSGVTTAGIAWNTWTGIFHLTGFANAVSRVGVGNTARGIGRFFGDASKMTLTSNWVYDQSDYMKQRATTQSKHLSELSNRYDAKGPIGSQIARIPGAQASGEFIHRSFHAFIDRALRITSVPTWTGAYLDAVDKGEQHDRAVALADQAVRDSHGDGDIQDTAEAMRSKGITSLFTSFMMWFSTAYNQMTESNKLAVKNPSPGTIAKAASDFLLIAIAPAATLSVLHGLYNGDDKKKILHKTEGEVAGGLLSFFPYLRELSPAVASLVSGEPVRSYEGPAGTRFIQAGAEFMKQAQHDGATAKLLPAANAMGGVLFHYPAAQVQRTASGVMALADGKSKNPTAVMFGPPPKK